MSGWKKLKVAFKQVCTWLKEEKSIWAWLVNLAIAFVVIKFLVYPGLGFVLGTPLPVVAVVSSSMDHDATGSIICGKTAPLDYKDNLEGYWQICGSWYEERGITAEQFQTFPFNGGFNKGDIMVLWGHSDIHVGDIVVYEAQQRYPIIHRAITVNETTLSTKGDHNPASIQEYALLQDGVAYRYELNGKPTSLYLGKPVTKDTPGAVALIDETAVSHEQVIGKAVFRIPWLGYVKIWFTNLISVIY